MLQAKHLYGLLDAGATENPDAPAFRYRNERLTYGDWRRLAERMSAVFAARGVGRGDVVTLLLPTTPLYQVAYLATSRLGAITTGINVRYRRTEIGHILQRSGARLVFGVDAFYGADFRGMIEALRPELPELRETLWVDAKEVTDGTAAVVEKLAGDLATPPPADVQPSDPVAIVFTSGTTGIPKGAWYAHENVLALAEIETRRYKSRRPPAAHLVTGVSFAHVGFMARAGIGLSHQTCTIIHDEFDPAAVLETIERERLSDIGGFPTQVVLLLDHPDCAKRDMSSVETVLLGGAPSTPALIRRVQETLKARVSVRYSSTEIGIGSASLPDDPPEILATTVGKPTSGVELRIVDDENRPLPTGEYGNVVVRSGATMRGYWRDEEATRKTIDEAGWIHTGDVGAVDEAGYVHLRGRQSEMYIRGGFNVYPSEIEDLLGKHPKVARAAIVGLPDDVHGEIGCAFVVPRKPDDPPTLAELRAWVGDSLASFKRPDRLTLLPELPATPMFKIDKRALKEIGLRG
ncbi:MAG: AMP-binding protein [Deltaproteobacteria bacterium]|nr:AMP-binding protein [Deltaproteobacteria bacterium]